MKRIAREMNMTVYLGIPHGEEVLYIECMYPDETIGWRHILGEHAPMYCTGLGKAMLAYLPDAMDITCAKGRFARFTERTLVTPEALRADMAATRERGYAIDNMEHEIGISCIGAPIFGHDGQVVAAISVSASTLLLTEDIMEPTAARLREILADAQHKL